MIKTIYFGKVLNNNHKRAIKWLNYSPALRGHISNNFVALIKAIAFRDNLVALKAIKEALPWDFYKHQAQVLYWANYFGGNKVLKYGLEHFV